MKKIIFYSIIMFVIIFLMIILSLFRGIYQTRRNIPRIVLLTEISKNSTYAISFSFPQNLYHGFTFALGSDKEYIFDYLDGYIYIYINGEVITQIDLSKKSIYGINHLNDENSKHVRTIKSLRFNTGDGKLKISGNIIDLKKDDALSLVLNNINIKNTSIAEGNIYLYLSYAGLEYMPSIIYDYDIFEPVLVLSKNPSDGKVVNDGEMPDGNN